MCCKPDDSASVLPSAVSAGFGTSCGPEVPPTCERPSPIAHRADSGQRRTVGSGGLENRFGPLGPTRVQIPPPPLLKPKPAPHAGLRRSPTLAVQSTGVHGSPLF